MTKEYFVMWREDFEDYDGWFDEVELASLVDRIWDAEEAKEFGEPQIYMIIKGKDITKEYGVES